ncbi:hypothetical protein P8452_52464 [Trifolium repens]|nr:hypothetical protein P8452_52464 [Trifolium repens]
MNAYLPSALQVPYQGQYYVAAAAPVQSQQPAPQRPQYQPVRPNHWGQAPGYNGPNINVVEENTDFDVIKNIEEVKTPLLMVHTKLAKCGLIKGAYDNCEECALSSKGCQVVKKQVQELINQGILQINRARKMEDVSVIEPHFESNKGIPKPVEILYQRRDDQPLMNQKQPIVICIPAPFPYKSSKAVPWDYNATAFVQKSEAKEEGSKSLEQLWDMPMKKDKYGLGYKPSMEKGNTAKIPIGNIRETFCGAGFASEDQVAVIEDAPDDGKMPCSVYRRSQNASLNNWTAIEIPEMFSFSKSQNKRVEYDTATIMHNLELPINQAEEDCESDCELPDELARLLEQESKEIQPNQEPVELINLGTEHDKREVKIGSSLKAEEHEKLVELLKEYADVFAWSYLDMPGLDTDIVEHKLPLRPECPPVKQKLRRTRPDMSLKISAEERWQSADVCRLPRPKQSKSQ